MLPPHTLTAAISQNLLREGPFGSMWAAHTNDVGVIAGWEERGPQWRGFSTGGTKILFRLGGSAASRLCVTEAAIDAMSLAAFEGLRDGTLYLSTGGGGLRQQMRRCAYLPVLPASSWSRQLTMTRRATRSPIGFEPLPKKRAAAGSDCGLLQTTGTRLCKRGRRNEEKEGGKGKACGIRAGHIKGSFARPEAGP